MKGKILTSGVISAEDGKRYNYADEDFKDEKNPKKGDEVDFIIENEKAKEIYILKQQLSLASLNADTDMGKIRIMAMVALVLFAIGSFKPLYPISLFGAGLIIYSIYKLNGIVKSETLYSNYLTSTILSILGSLIAYFTLRSSMEHIIFSIFSGYSPHIPAGVVIGLGMALSGLFWKYKAYEELSKISENKFFLYSFFCFIGGILTYPFKFGIVILLGAYIVEFIAWFQFEDVKSPQTT